MRDGMVPRLAVITPTQRARPARNRTRSSTCCRNRTSTSRPVPGPQCSEPCSSTWSTAGRSRAWGGR